MTLETERIEGEISSFEALSLDLSDDDVALAIGNRVSTSETFWNNELNLDNVRKKNEQYWHNEVDEDGLYDYQEKNKNKNNRIFTSIETLIPMVTSKPAQPVVTEAYDSDASRQLAQDLGHVLLAKYEDLYLRKQFELTARHLAGGMRCGIHKYRWDASIGRMVPDPTDPNGGMMRKGDIAVESIRPDKVVFAEGTSFNKTEDIDMIAEYVETSLEELCMKFPDKQTDILRVLGADEAGNSVPMSKRVKHVEVWFTYFDKNRREKKEGVAWTLNKKVLGKIKNPHWNYDEYTKDENGEIKYLNFFDRPKKPYVVYNYLNNGKYVLDTTSLVEQASSQQDNLNKRKRQIGESADQPNGGLVLNSTLIKPEQISRITGNPNEKISVAGDVRLAAARLPRNDVSPTIIGDVNDTRNEIDNVFGTHNPTRGESSGNKNLGQDVLSQRGDMSRSRTLGTAIEDGSQRLYGGMTQMFKVFYDSADIIRYSGPDGKTSFIPFSNNSIEIGMQVRVKSGSVLPEDPTAKEQKTMTMAPLLDPLAIAQGLGLENPKEAAYNMMLSKMAPDKYIQEVLGKSLDGQQDPDAVADIKMLNSGQAAPPQESPSQNHLAQHQAFIESDQFKQLPPEIQQLHMDHVKAEIANSKKALGQESGQPAQNPEVAPAPDTGGGGKQGLVQNLMQLFTGK